MKILRSLSILVIFFCVGALLVLLLAQYVDSSTKLYRYQKVTDIPHHRVGMVFGASIRQGNLSPILQDRVDMAIQLYRAGKIEKLLMTGDNSTPNYDEVTAMQKYAVAHGIPEKDITLDYAGLSTYDSCYRAKQIFGLTDAVLVTQHYHMPRAVYSCRHLGIDAVGMEIQDWEKYPDLKEPSLVREELATSKMLWNIHIAHPLPKLLGKSESIK